MYRPPPGPPPGWTPHQQQQQQQDEVYDNPPPYHNWQEQVPDTAMLPPPPAISRFASETGNASEDDAERAKEFCAERPLWRPVRPSEPIYTSTQYGDIRPGQPIEYRGSLDTPSRGLWRIRSDKNCRDCSIISLLPLYYAERDSPMLTERGKTIYFEVKIKTFHRRPFGGDASGFSLGFVAQPYPSWRSPGWDRASLGVFSDDGCRFVNDNLGGKDFTSAFRTGETVGLGMRFDLPAAESQEMKPNVRVFFTRNGVETGGWDLHEQLDSEAEGVYGLEGDFDLYAAVGVFGGVDVEVQFDRKKWLFKQ